MGRIVSQLLGKDEQTFPNVDAALKAGGLDWTVTKHPLFVRIPTEPGHGIFKRDAGMYGIVRSDNNAVLGEVAGRYETMSNAEVFGPLDEIKDEAGIVIASAAQLDGGETVFMQARSTEPMQIAGERIDDYLLFFTKHDGGGRMRGFDAPNRFFCTNQLRAIAKGSHLEIAISHTSSAKQRLEGLRVLIRGMRQNRQNFIRTAEDLLADTFTRSEAEALYRQVLPPPDASDPHTTDRMVRNYDQRFESLMREAYEAPDLNDIRYTPWGAINALADFEQHLLPVRGEGAKVDETLFKRAMFNGDLVEHAYAILRPNAAKAVR